MSCMKTHGDFSVGNGSPQMSCSFHNGNPGYAHAAGRWGSCWPGTAACQRRKCRGTGGGRAGSVCRAGLTGTPHTHCYCHCSRHPKAVETRSACQWLPKSLRWPDAAQSQPFCVCVPPSQEAVWQREREVSGHTELPEHHGGAPGSYAGQSSCLPQLQTGYKEAEKGRAALNATTAGTLYSAKSLADLTGKYFHLYQLPETTPGPGRRVRKYLNHHPGSQTCLLSGTLPHIIISALPRATSELQLQHQVAAIETRWLTWCNGTHL